MNLLPDTANLDQIVFGYDPGIFTGLFFDTANLDQIALGGDDVFYPNYSSTEEIEQPGSAFISVETLLKVPYNVVAITDVAPELLAGVNYSRLEEMETEIEELTLLREGGEIIGITVSDIQIDIVI